MLPLTQVEQFTQKHLRYNVFFNTLDGGFFGFAIGFASFVTVLPLFVSTFTDSAVLIGLIGSLRAIGWQVPQLFTTNHVAGLRRYKPTVILMTLNERFPFVLLAGVAWFAQ